MYAALQEALATVDYTSELINVIELLKRYPRWRSLPDSPVHVRYARRMDAGNQFREAIQKKEALALLAMAAIKAVRKKRNPDPGRPLKPRAYVIRSLKTPEEVEILRAVYGENCFIVAAYSPKEHRASVLASRIAASLSDPDSAKYRADAYRLINRDEAEYDTVFGQNLRETFHLADAFIDASEPKCAQDEILRFVEVLFGHPVRTPSRVEFGMFQAHGAAMSSASAARQIGAAIATADGEIVSVGTNEVAKAGGGQYWGEDGVAKDFRDYRRPGDTNKQYINNIIIDIFARLKKKGWLSKTQASRSPDALARSAHRQLLRPLRRSAAEAPTLEQKALILNLIEFLRPVHAEMAALMSAARRGASVQGCTLFTTTFPCHECARHIVSAGISRLIFISPYSKSRVPELYDDSIAVDGQGDATHVPFHAFVGIAPRQYLPLFSAPLRKTRDDEWVVWDRVKRTNRPKFARDAVSYLGRESELVAVVGELAREKRLR